MTHPEKTVRIRLPRKTHDRLAKLAAARGETPSEVLDRLARFCLDMVGGSLPQATEPVAGVFCVGKNRSET